MGRLFSGVHGLWGWGVSLAGSMAYGGGESVLAGSMAYWFGSLFSRVNGLWGGDSVY